MAENIPKMLEKGFQNWLKANLALNITKDGVEDAVVNEIETFHRDLLNEILTPEQVLNKDFCTQCTKENIIQCPTRGICVVKLGECSLHNSRHKYYRPCPKGVCDRLRDKIKKCHRFNFPSWKNTNTEKWCQNPWELAKCYLPPDGYISVNTIAETDLNGILSLIMNHAVFKNQVDEKACEKNRYIGKIIRHSPNLSIDETDLNTYLDTLVTFFTCSSLFQRDLKAAASVQKITQLKGESLTITTNDVTRVLLDVINENTRGSLESINKITAERAVEAKADLDKLEAITSKHLKDILTAKETAISQIHTTRDTAIQDVSSSAEQIKSDMYKGIEKTKLATETQIQSFTDTAKEELKLSATELQSGMNKDVGKTKLEAETHIQSYTGTAKEELKSTATELKSNMNTDIEKTKLAAETHLQSYTDTAKDELKSCTKELKSDMNKDIEKTKLAAETHIQSYSDTVKEELKSSAEEQKSDMNKSIEKTKIAAVTYVQSYNDKSTDKAKTELKSCAEQLKSDINDDLEKTKIAAVASMKHMEQFSIQNIKKAASDICVPVEQLTEENYQVLKRELREDLLAFNQENHSTMPLSPLFHEHDTELIGFYVSPALNSIEIRKTELRGPASEVRMPISGLRDVFHKKSYRCKNVVLTSEAGQGKTAFCKRLALTWCNAHQIDNNAIRHFANDDLLTMREFSYLFLVSLRDSSVADCDIDDMIRNQVVQYLSRAAKYSADVMQTIFHRETTLVLLDGLDEWSHPEKKDSSCRRKPEYLPHRKVREKCTILTTTRSWKLSIAKLKTSQTDHHIEIDSLDSKQLMKNTFTKINTDVTNPDVVDENIEKLSAEIRSGSIEDLTGNPLILTYLICLWCCGKPIGHSRCAVYSNILELLLLRAEEKHARLEDNDFALDPNDNVTLPSCFESRQNIKASYKFLISLGELAFYALFSRNKDISLVFDYSLVSSILTQQAYQFSLLAGLLVQSKVPGQLISRDTRISFSHKTFQEFFAAMYIQSLSDVSQMSEQVLERCNSVKAILEMSNVFIFVSGLGPEKFNFLSEKLRTFVNKDDITIAYRREFCNSFTTYQISKDIQNMCIACFKESRNNDCKLILQDVILDKDCCDEKYSCLLQRITLMNIKNIKSVQYVNSVSEDATRETIGLFNLKEIHTLEMLDFTCPIINDDLEILLAGSIDTLKRISVKGLTLQRGRYIQTSCNTVSENSVTSLRNMNQLESISFEFMKIPHSHLECLISYFSHKTSMKQIILFDIKCTDHGETCPGFNMDLSQHSQLNTAGFGELPLSYLQINTSTLEKCLLGNFQNGNTISSFVPYLSSASELIFLQCRGLNVDLDFVLDMIPLLARLRVLWMTDIDLGNRLINLSPEMLDIECVIMKKTRITSASFEQLVQDVKQFQQSVRVELWNCTVTPAAEYVRIKNYIKMSDTFVVTRDGMGQSFQGEINYIFQFKTIDGHNAESVC